MPGEVVVIVDQDPAKLSMQDLQKNSDDIEKIRVAYTDDIVKKQADQLTEREAKLKELQAELQRLMAEVLVPKKRYHSYGAVAPASPKRQ